MKPIFNWVNRYKSVVVLALAGVLLLLAQSSFWINHTIFDQKTFTTILGTTLQTESNKQAIAKVIVNKALQDRPLLNRTVGEKTTTLVAGLLGTDFASQTFDTLINRSYAYLTSEDPEPIAIDLLSIKTPIAGLVSFAELLGRDVSFDPNSIPDSILIFSSEDLPDIYKFSISMLWLGPIFWLSGLGLLIAYVYRGRKSLNKRVYIAGGVIIASSVIGIAFGPLLPPPLVALVPTIELRPVVNSVIAALLQPFIMQMINTIVLVIIGLVIFSQRLNILNIFQRLIQKIYKNTTKNITSKKKK